MKFATEEMPSSHRQMRTKRNVKREGLCGSTQMVKWWFWVIWMKSVTPVILFGHCCARRYTHREIVVDDMEAVHVKHVSVILFARSSVNIIHETAITSHHMAESWMPKNVEDNAIPLVCRVSVWRHNKSSSTCFLFVRTKNPIFDCASTYISTSWCVCVYYLTIPRTIGTR